MIKLILSLTITLSLSLPHSLLAKSGYEAALEVAQAKRVSKVVDNINILHKKINKYILENASLPTSTDIASVDSYAKNAKVVFEVDDSKVRYSNIIPDSFDDTQKNLLRQSTSLDSLAVVNTNMTMDIALEPGVILFLEQKDSLSANEVLSFTPPADTTKLWYQPNGQGGFIVKKYDGANWVVSIKNTASSSAKKDDIIVKTKEELDKLKAKKGDKAYISKDNNSISGYVYDGKKWLLESVASSSKVANVCTSSDIGIMKYDKDTNCMQSCQSDGSGGYAWECVEGKKVASTEPVSSNNYDKTTPKVSCKAHLDAGATEDGIYKINPSGTVFDAYCDMTTDGGGWTKIIHGSDTTLDYLSHFGNTSNISSTFYTDSTKGIGWGTNDRYYKEFFIKDLKFDKYRVVFSGSYNSPSGGLGTLSICNATNQGKYWNQTTSGTISLYLNDGNAPSSDGQVFMVNGSTIFSGTQDVLNRTEIISAYSPYITMTGYTSSYPYTKRYIKEFWVK